MFMLTNHGRLVRRGLVAILVFTLRLCGSNPVETRQWSEVGRKTGLIYWQSKVKI